MEKKAPVQVIVLGLAVAVVCCAACTYIHFIDSKTYELFNDKDLAIVNWAYNQDSTAQTLTAKNDDGHTKMWNAASPHEKFHKAAVQEPSSFYGAPKFFAHATGWVNDYSVGRAKANGASRSAGLATAGTAQTTMLAQEDLWNAASNDEITVENEGHLHPSEMNELQKLSPEYSKLPHISSQKDMDYHPMKWLKSEQESSSPHHVRLSKFKSTGTALSPKGIFEKLWNAAADDEIGGDPSADEPGHLEYKPRKWLRHQHDEAEMAEMHPRHGKRIFGGVQDHELNYDGAFVSDNSIGVHIGKV